MIPAWTYSDVTRRLRSIFEQTRAHAASDVRLVGLLFSRPTSELAKKEILPDLDYFHYRSGDDFDIFCAGYSRYGDASGIAVTSDDPPWMFDVRKFVDFQRDIETRSCWKYNGETDLVLLNARYDKGRNSGELDFSSAIVCDIESMIEHKAINNLHRFFEILVNYASTSVSKNPAFDLSDELGLTTGKSVLKARLLAMLPLGLGDAYLQSEPFAIRDISKLGPR